MSAKQTSEPRVFGSMTVAELAARFTALAERVYDSVPECGGCHCGYCGTCPLCGWTDPCAHLYGGACMTS